MSNPSVVLHLDSHCIKTAAHREFMRLVDLCMILPLDAEDKDLEFKIEMLRRFLEKTDFTALRASDPRLTGIHEAWVRLAWNGNFRLDISEEPIEQ